MLGGVADCKEKKAPKFKYGKKNPN